MKNRMVSLVLILSLLVSLVLPMGVGASETETIAPHTTETTEATVSEEETLEPDCAEETAAATEETAAATEEAILSEERIQALLEDIRLNPGPEQVVVVEDVISGEAMDAVATGAPAVKWIDRLANLPDFARNFYNWLVENSDGDGYNDDLFNPATGIVVEGYDGCFFAEVAQRTNNSTTFSCDPNASDEEIAAVIEEALVRDYSAWAEEVFAYIPAVYGAFMRDHPEVFWLSGECVWELFFKDMYLEQVGNNTFELTYDLYVYFILMLPEFDVRHEDYRNVSIVTQARVDRDNAVANIVAGATGSRYEQVKYLNDWLTTHNCYNTSSNLNALGSDSESCISALMGRTGTNGPVCEGYASAFKVLCDKLGIPCVLVNGIANNDSHMWNYVQMEDGNWYAVDVTWNDPVISGVTGAKSGYENEEYLLVGSGTVVDGTQFCASHVVENVVMDDGTAFTNGPALSETKYELHVHDYVPAVTAPTCIEQGYTTYTCSCGDSYVDDYVAATGEHVYTNSQDAVCDTCGGALRLPTAPEGADYTPMYRLYNPNSGEHFYTGSVEETQNLVSAGWQYEGVAWNAPISEGAPVYRVFNPNNGDHHYTMSQEEVDMLVEVGWKYEGVAWNSASKDNVPQYRLYNPNADCGSHHYTSSTEERDYLVSLGWIYEGIGWYGIP